MVVKNNPPHLFESLDSIYNLVSEMIVVDIGIEEKVKEKLKCFSRVKLISLKEEIPFIELIRERSKKFVREDHALFIDPDEIWMPNLKKMIKSNLGKYDYFLIPRKNLIFGKWIKHSRWWPDYQVRVFKKDKAIWPKEIHSQPKTSGKGLKIEAYEELTIVHHNYESIDDFFSKMTRYAKAEAGNLIERKKPFSLEEAVKKSISEFMSRFFAEEGYKDGMHGFVLAVLQMFYCFLVYFYYWEKQRDKENNKFFVKEALSFFKKGLYETQFWLIKKRLVTKKEQIRTKVLNWFIKF